MIHEFIEIIQSYKAAKQKGLRSVLATVVDLDGSSYRKPGVRMIIHENGKITGAVSGGCVEKEILKQSFSVFETGEPKIITYDGRYRLGCEGVLYILIEIFDPEEMMFNAIDHGIKKRDSFEIECFYTKEVTINSNFGSVINIDGEQYAFAGSKISKSRNRSELKIFKQKLDSLLRLFIIGTDHDAAQLSLQATSLGWEVVIIASLSSPQELNDFPGAKQIIYSSSEDFDLSLIDNNSAIVLMTHNSAKDLQFLSKLKDSFPVYLGLLGAMNRRDRLLNEFIEKHPNIEDSFLDIIYGPTGLNIGAITPQEIALSICAEILSVVRKEESKSLKKRTKAIHLQWNPLNE